MTEPQKLKALIVDDEAYMHRLLQYHLQRAGFHTLDGYNGREAVALAREQRPRVIVMDLMMPELDGLSALKELKKCDQTRDIPVIMLTANGHHVTREEAQASGAAVFLTKPFSPTHLLRAIRDLIPEALPM